MGQLMRKVEAYELGELCGVHAGREGVGDWEVGIRRSSIGILPLWLLRHSVGAHQRPAICKDVL
jgi:hypothetical protein